VTAGALGDAYTRASWDPLVDVARMLHYGFMRHAFEAATVVAVVAGLVGYFVVLRSLAFAAHALSHVGFAGATGAVALGLSPVAGVVVLSAAAAAGIGAMGARLRERDVAVGMVMAFSLGLGAFFLALYAGFANEAVAILFGEVLGVSPGDVAFSWAAGAVVLAGLAALYRPLLFSSLDEEVAEAKGVRVRRVSVAFMVLLALAVAEAVQVVGVLLVFALLVAPPAIAQRLARRPARGLLLSAGLSVAFCWAGLTLGYWTPYPVSFYITGLAFAAYLAARAGRPALLASRPVSWRPGGPGG
jgi:zinc/manganese transport system permease protein